MGRKAHADYIKAALEVLQELGGGPLPTKTLIAAAQERGLIGDKKWVYYNFSRKIRDSALFDTTVRGQVSLMPMLQEAAPIIEAPEPVEEETTSEPEVQKFPNSILGVGLGDQ